MRRKTLKAIACAAAMALVLSVTACGGSDDKSGNTGVAEVEDSADTVDTTDTADDAEVADTVDNDEPETAVDDEADAAEEDAGTEDGSDESGSGAAEYASLEEAFADPEAKAQMDDMISSLEEDGMLVSYEVSGNDFIVIYQFTDITVDDVDGLSEAMGEAMGQLEGVFVELAKMFDEELGQEGASKITVRCLDAADSVLFENTYSAK